MSRVKAAIIALVVLVMVTGATACGQAQAQNQPALSGKSVQVIKSDGEIKLVRERKLSFGVPGRIEAIDVKEGDKVSSGQVMARVEIAPLERAVKVAALAVDSARADIKQAEFAVKVAEADVKQAKNGLKAAQADMQQADFGVKAAEADLGQAAIAVKAAEADLEIGKDNYRKITYPYTYSTFAFDVPQALASISNAEREMADAQKALATPGLTPDEYAQSLLQLKKAQDNLTEARQSLARGQGIDVFLSGQASTQDFWTLRNAQLGKTKAELGVENAASLYSKAQLALNIARGTADKAGLAAEAAQMVLDKSQTSLENARNNLNKSLLAADKAEYDLASAREALDKATITAPFSGIAARVNVKTGDMLTAADYSKTAIDFIDPTAIEVSVMVDEMDIPGVGLGQEATISVDALPNAKLKGKVNFISDLPEVRTGVVQYEVRVSLDMPATLGLKAGMRGSATFDKS